MAASSFTFTTSPDDQWRIVDAGRYRITFNLRDWTIAVRFLGGDEPGGEKEPIETSALYMIGDATPNGWSMDDATEFTVSPSDKYVFVWEGELKEGNMKACLERRAPELKSAARVWLLPASYSQRIPMISGASPRLGATASPSISVTGQSPLNQ